MRHEALLLTRDSLSGPDCKIAKLLEFFGVRWHAETTAQFLGRNCTKHSKMTQLFCSSKIFLELLTEFAPDGDRGQDWREHVHSVFVYGGDDPTQLETLLRHVTGNDTTTVNEPNGWARNFFVAKDTELCGAMAGVQVTASSVSNAPVVVRSRSSQSGTRELVSDEHGGIFLKVEYRGVFVFLSTSGQIIDLDSELATGVFDIRDHVPAALPIVLYIKWAFADVCWEPAEANACLVIDDPLLKPSYGCVNFEELLALMERHRFSTNIAFIPWNWRRSNSRVVGLFNQKPEHYSLSIHGCDHTAAEFGSHDRERLRRMTREAVDRMSSHETQTGIHHDRIMVFPQGVFSEAAMDVLKRSNFTAAVNNDVMSADPHPQAVTISDVWDIAVMRYKGFPMFTRRDPCEGIENFAFDILLGKPCVVSIHHDFCRDHYTHLLDFIDRLNALNCPLSWRSLGEVVRRGCRQRQLSPGVRQTEMYGAELRLENRSGQRERYLIRRRECEPSAIKEICDGSGPIAWNCVNDHINFETELGSGQSKTIGIRFHEFAGNGYSGENVSYRFKAMLRRYLSEVRDNYIVKNNLHLPDLFG